MPIPPPSPFDAAPSAADVRDAYRLFLGREAESDAIATWHAARSPNLGALFQRLMTSDEFTLRMSTRADDEALTAALQARLNALPVGPTIDCPPGFSPDPIGMVVDAGAAAYWQDRDGGPHDVFKGQAIEWWALLDAVLAAGARPTLVELGCGYGPWLARGAIALRRLRGAAAAMTLVGVEGEPSHLDLLRAHFGRNGLDADAVRIWRGAIGVVDGELEFETRAPGVASWGTRRAAASDDPFLPRVERPRMIRVPCWGLATILDGLGAVDLLHVDIQGDEALVLAAGGDALARQVRRLIVGTHGRGIEQALMEELVKRNFALVGEQACRYAIHGGRPLLIEDGAQYWRNRAFDGAA